MDNEENAQAERARIIRYTTLPDGLLSRLDRQKNILEIDVNERRFLTPSMQNLLDCSDDDATRIVSIKGGIGFEPVYISKS